jgi:hypothetical protein
MGNSNKPNQNPEEEPVEVKISVQEFYDTKLYSDNDKRVMQKMYEHKSKMTATEWAVFLAPNFNEVK